MPKLVLTTEAQGKVAYEFAERSITIGRAPDNMIVIDDASVSNRHAQLELVGETYRLKDLESTNGTKVNGVPITETLLRFEDRIRFGAIEARFEPDVRGSQPLPQLGVAVMVASRGHRARIAPQSRRNESGPRTARVFR